MENNKIKISKCENINSLFEMLDVAKTNKIHHVYDIFFKQKINSSQVYATAYVVFSSNRLENIEDLAIDGEEKFLEKYSELYAKENPDFSIFKANILKEDLQKFIEVYTIKYLANSVFFDLFSKILNLNSDTDFSYPFIKVLISKGILSAPEVNFINKLINKRPKLISKEQKEKINNISVDAILKLIASGKISEIFDMNGPISIGDYPEIESVESYLKRIKHK